MSARARVCVCVCVGVCLVGISRDEAQKLGFWPWQKMGGSFPFLPDGRCVKLEGTAGPLLTFRLGRVLNYQKMLLDRSELTLPRLAPDPPPLNLPPKPPYTCGCTGLACIQQLSTRPVLTAARARASFLFLTGPSPAHNVAKWCHDRSLSMRRRLLGMRSLTATSFHP
jgi:hypothetical protein